MPMLIYCKGRVCRNQPYECWDSHAINAEYAGGQRHGARPAPVGAGIDVDAMQSLERRRGAAGLLGEFDLLGDEGHGTANHRHLHGHGRIGIESQ